MLSRLTSPQVAFLVYPVARGEDYEKKAVGCIVKHDRADLQVTSFQQHGIGFAAAKPFEFNMEPENAYTVRTSIAFPTQQLK